MQACQAFVLTKVSHAGGPADLRPGAGASEGVGCDRRRRPRALVSPVQAFPRRDVRTARTATVVIAPDASGTEHIGGRRRRRSARAPLILVPCSPCAPWLTIRSRSAHQMRARKQNGGTMDIDALEGLVRARELTVAEALLEAPIAHLDEVLPLLKRHAPPETSALLPRRF